jgi:hypothetical protein
MAPWGMTLRGARRPVAWQRTSWSWSARNASTDLGVSRLSTSSPAWTRGRRPMRPRRPGRYRGGAASLRSWWHGRDARLPRHQVNACPCSGQLVESPVRDEHRSVLGHAPVDRERFRQEEPESTALADEPGVGTDDSHLASAGYVAHRSALTDPMKFCHRRPRARSISPVPRRGGGATNMPPPHRPRGVWLFKPMALSAKRMACTFARPGIVAPEHSHPCNVEVEATPPRLPISAAGPSAVAWEP